MKRVIARGTAAEAASEAVLAPPGRSTRGTAVRRDPTGVKVGSVEFTIDDGMRVRTLLRSNRNVAAAACQGFHTHADGPTMGCGTRSRPTKR
jgi:Cu/Zn superoxide dismutase